MKRLLFLPVCLLAMLFSCKKSGSSKSSNSTISATLNDTAQTFNTSATALYQSSNGIYDLAITGYVSSATNSNAITISIGGTSPIAVGTYSDGGIAPDAVSMVYSLSGGTSAYAAMGTATVTITSITGSNVQGTFSGVLNLYSGNATNTTETVTNGKFNVAIQ
jgi:hypothetical protein